MSDTPSKSTWDRIVAWCKAKWRYIALAFALIFAGVFGVQRLRDRNEAKLSEKARKDVERARARLAALRESRAELDGRVEARQEEIELVEAHLATTRRVIVQSYEETQEMSDDEVLDRFRALGYD